MKRRRRRPADPVVIGATGGSGTRVVVRMLQTFGVALGNRLNESLDPYVFMRFYDRWIDPFVLDRTGRQALSRRERARMVDELREAVDAHLEDAKPTPGAVWGWKSPRSIFLLPLLAEVFSEMRFVQVVRDPRDMAFSANQRQLESHGALYLTPEERAEPVPVQSALLWKRVNDDARSFGATMGDRYLLVRFEELCDDPAGSAKALASFVGVVPDDGRVREAATHVSEPSTVGRWKSEDQATSARVRQALGEALERFGYRS
ncbi:MAG: sulfotransferase family protein [Actinomycetota bacterium]